MGIVIYSLGVSLDGFMESPGREIGWAAPDEEVHRFANEQAAESSGSVYGRHLYEVMAGYWPDVPNNPDAHEVEREFAAIWLATPPAGVLPRAPDGRSSRCSMQRSRLSRSQPGASTSPEWSTSATARSLSRRPSRSCA